MVDRQNARNFGSNFTTFRYNGQSIAYLQLVQDSGQAPVGVNGGYQFIQPLGSDHPEEIVTSRAIGGGLLQLNITELWHQEVWQQMQGLAGTKDILEVFRALARMQNYVTCTKIITPPDGRKYGKTYHRCTIVSVPDGESFDITALSQAKTVTVAYTHTTPL